MRKKTDNPVEMKRIAYTYVCVDVFHYGHLKLLQQARAVADYHVCGLLSDPVAEKLLGAVIMNYEERKQVLEALTCVDEVIEQDSGDPTENLKTLHSRYPAATLILFQGHQKWGRMPGVEFVESVGGQVIRPDYYNRLSREKIAKVFLDGVMAGHKKTAAVSKDVTLGNIVAFDGESKTKADMLQSLKAVLTKGKIEEVFLFTVGQWAANREAIAANVRRVFTSTTIVVRSSALNEDSAQASNAGLFNSELGVDSGSADAVSRAVDKVVASYRNAGSESTLNQILIQRQTDQVVVSGVVFTRNLETNTPYYAIAFDDSGAATDTVTGGRAGKRIEILRETATEDVPTGWRGLLEAVRELEALLSDLVLDIEFAITADGTVVIFQVRPLAANARFITFDDETIRHRVARFKSEYRRLADRPAVQVPEVYLSDMAFWNPAEIIGDRADYLAASLYDFLILREKWNEGLVPLGYTRVPDSLMVLVGSKPYINVQYAFLALLPAALPNSLKEKLLQYCNRKLKAHPDLHDKIEFEIVPNCLDFSFGRRAEELRLQGFSTDELACLRQALLELTNAILEGADAIIRRDLDDFRVLTELRDGVMGRLEASAPSWGSRLEAAQQILEACRSHGTAQFSRIARLAFVGQAILKSLLGQGLVSEQEYHAFLESLATVVTRMDEDFANVRAGLLTREAFIERYGHLRPGTYDITKPSYRENPAYLSHSGLGAPKPMKSHSAPAAWIPSPETADRITRACEAEGLRISAPRLFEFIRHALEMREYTKFEFTRNLSAALDLLAAAGAELGVSRSELAHLGLYEIMMGLSCPDRNQLCHTWRLLAEARVEEARIDRLVSLSPLVFSENDFQVVQSYVSLPNFITQETVTADVTVLDAVEGGGNQPDGKIVVVEKADPGYDWIFTHDICGLVTKYGGAASHMAIRCAEFGIPAAIGCGDLLFSAVEGAKTIRLDCRNRRIEILRMMDHASDHHATTQSE